METKLKPCPFCGGKAHVTYDYSSESGDWWCIDCLSDDCPMYHQRGAWDIVCVSTGWRTTEAEAIEAWNTRHERTCDRKWEHSGPFFDSFKCSECLYEFYEPRCVHGYSDLVANYCPNCGARVKEKYDAE